MDVLYLQECLSSMNEEADELLDKLERLETALDYAKSQWDELPDCDMLNDLCESAGRLVGELEEAREVGDALPLGF